MNALLDAALGYAARGIPVYPVHWPRPTPGGASLACSCPRGPACDRPAKHPLVRHGVHDATTDPDQLEPLVATLAAGQCRPGHRHRASTPSTSTAPPAWPPSGSSHERRACGSPVRWWPRGAVAGTTGSPRPGWATAHPEASPTSTGAAAAAACSPHPAATSPAAATAGCVGLDQAPLPEVPAALRALLDPDRPTTTRPGPPRPTGRPRPATRTAAGSWPPNWPPSAGPPPASATAPSTGAAFKVYRYVAGGLLDDHDVTAAFTPAALAIGLDPAEVGRTLASARTAGLANPRTVPAEPGRSSEEDGS